jgi:hypothetical protein
MSTATVEAATTPVIPQPSAIPPADGEFPYLFSNEQFFGMVEAGIFPEGARVYLWEGRVLQKMAKIRATEVAALMFNQTLSEIVPKGWLVGFEHSVASGLGRVPLPDVIVLRGKPRDYMINRPTAADVALVVELSYSSQRHDTGRKMAGYARAGFPTYWVANLVGGTIIEHRGPLPDEERYASVRTYQPGESLTLILDETTVGPIAVSDLIPV